MTKIMKSMHKIICHQYVTYKYLTYYLITLAMLSLNIFAIFKYISIYHVTHTWIEIINYADELSIHLKIRVFIWPYNTHSFNAI